MRGPVYYRRLGELAAYFLRLGVTAFGGPAAHIALMEEDCVRRRRWISHERFLDVLGASNLIPGPTSTELAMHIGYARAGYAGLVVAGTCFILPAAVLVALIAAMYVAGGALPALDGLLRAVKPVVVVIVLVALINLARTAVRTPTAVIVATAAVVLAGLRVNEALVLVVGGLTSMFMRWRPTTMTMVVVLLPDLFAYFVRAGSMILGSGYVLFAILRGDLVDGRRWLSEGQLLDAIAVGQITPGPVFTAATFIGYLLAGPGGAAAATVGIFLPAFLFSALSARFLELVARSDAARAFLDGVNAAAVALIGVVLASLIPHAIVDVGTALVGVAAAVAIGWFRVNAAWVLLAAAAMGSVARLL